MEEKNSNAKLDAEFATLQPISPTVHLVWMDFPLIQHQENA